MLQEIKIVILCLYSLIRCLCYSWAIKTFVSIYILHFGYRYVAQESFLACFLKAASQEMDVIS